jgi:hypothetical protein
MAPRTVDPGTSNQELPKDTLESIGAHFATGPKLATYDPFRQEAAGNVFSTSRVPAVQMSPAKARKLAAATTKLSAPPTSQWTVSTPESPHASNTTTCSDSSSSSEPHTPTPSPSPTAPPDSTSSAKACFRYYNSRLKGVYDTCTLPTKTDYAASHTISSNMYSRHMVQRSSWTHEVMTPPPTSRTSQTTSFPSSPFLALVSTDGAAEKAVDASAQSNKRQKHKAHDDPEAANAVEEGDEAVASKPRAFKRKRELDGVLRTYKVRMVPTSAQRAELRLAFAVARRAYNWVVDRVNAGAKCNFITLRKAFFGEPLPTWALDAKGAPLVHTKVIARAIKQACDAFSTNWKKWRKDPSHKFHVGFRSLRQSYTEVIILERKASAGPLLGYKETISSHRDGRAECMLQLGGNFRRNGGMRLQDKSRVIERLLTEGADPMEDAKIMWDKRTNDFHFLYTFVQARVPPDPDPDFTCKRIVAGDGGERSFFQYGSPTDGTHGELLVGIREEISRRCGILEDLDSRIAKRKANSRRSGEHKRTARQRYETTRRLRRKLARERRRLHNWVEAAHYDAANFLLTRYDVLIMPKLQVAQMVPTNGRVFSSKVAKSMLTMSHGYFSTRLHSAASRYSGRHVISDSGEPGTSKTCSNCGFWHSQLGGSKVFRCPRCSICIDRDVNGWRGNLFAAYGKAVQIGWDGESG